MYSEKFGIVIAGAGLAGTTAAYSLSADHRVLLVDSRQIGSGATAVGAGIASPILARKGNPTYEAREALDCLGELCSAVNLDVDHSRPMIRPSFSETQTEYYRGAANRHADLATWIDPDELRDQYPGICGPRGALKVTRGHVINLPLFARTVSEAAASRGCTILENHSLSEWIESGDEVIVQIQDANGKQRTVRSDRLILSVGGGYRRFGAISRLNLHPIKGQTIRATRPSALEGLPNISGPGYLAHDDGDIVLGSTFVHGVFDTNPTDAATKDIIELIRPIVPSIQTIESFDALAGTRVTVPGTRLPMIGPIAESGRVWVYTGLGSKGLLMAPMLSSKLPAFLHNPDLIPELMRPHEST